MATATQRERELERYEEDFRCAGLPLFSEDFSASEDVWNRGTPILGLVFLVQVLGAGQLAWSWWQNLLAIGGALTGLLLLIALANKLRDHSFSVIPQTVGRAELAAFVILPGLLPIVFNDETYRKEFLDELTTEMRESFEARAKYLKLRDAN